MSMYGTQYCIILLDAILHDVVYIAKTLKLIVHDIVIARRLLKTDVAV